MDAITRFSDALFGGGLLSNPNYQAAQRAQAQQYQSQLDQQQAQQEAMRRRMATIAQALQGPPTQPTPQGGTGPQFFPLDGAPTQAQALADDHAQELAILGHSARPLPPRPQPQGVDIGQPLPPFNPAQQTLVRPQPQAPKPPQRSTADRLQAAGEQAFLQGMPDLGQKYLTAAAKLRPVAPDRTTLMQNAVGAGFRPGTPEFQQFIRAQLAKSGQTINVGTGDTGPQVGTIPQGFALYQRDDGGYEMRAVPGGPADIAAQEAARQAQAQDTQTDRYGGVVVQDVARALDLVDSSALPVTGFGSLLDSVPGTPAHDLSGLLLGIKSNTSFDRLQQMREASPTGGALGQVSDRENKKLEAAYGSLEQSQSKAQFTYNLKRVANIYSDIINGPGHRPYPNLNTGPIVSQAPIDMAQPGPPPPAPQPVGGIKFLGFE